MYLLCHWRSPNGLLEIVENYYRNIDGASVFMPEKLAKLRRNPDIMEEFAYWIQTRNYREQGVLAEGYTAKRLAGMLKYLDGEGAFMLLIELRENPSRARRRIAGGFKMK